MSNITFNESLEKYKPIYYHFLDGYIDPNIGYTQDKIYSFILNHIKLPYIDKITLLNVKVDIITYNINLIFTNIKSGIIKNYNINYNNIDRIFYDSILSEIIELFTYCIYQVSNDYHATSLVIFITNNILNIASFNSGKGIGYHDIVLNDNDNKYYSPFIGIKVCDNIKTDYLNGFNIILSYLIIPQLYNILIEKTYYNYKLFIEVFNNDISNISKKYYNLEPIIKLIMLLKFLNKKIDFTDFNFKINNCKLDKLEDIQPTIFYEKVIPIFEESAQNFISVISYKKTERTTPQSTPPRTTPQSTPPRTTPQSTPPRTTPQSTPPRTTPQSTPPRTTPQTSIIPITSTNILYNKPLIGKDIYNNKNYRCLLITDIKTELQTINYYKIITNMFKQYPVYKLINTEPFDNSLITELHINIKNKLILHYNNCDFYIYQQESGSCCWFSMYWPIIFYNIFNNNKDNYYLIITDIYIIFNNILKKIFSPINFIKIYNEEETNNSYMKILCEKFINIGLLESKILEDQKDFIYNVLFNIDDKVEIKKTVNNGLINAINGYKINKLLDLLNIIKFMDLFDILYNDDKYTFNINDKLNAIIYLITELFSYSYKNDIPLFNKSCPDKNILINFLCELNNNIVLNDDNKNLLFKNYNLELININIDGISYDLDNLINQFRETYNDTVEPIYLNNYIYWASTCSFINNNEILLEFIKFIHRFSLFILIYRTLNFIIYKSTKLYTTITENIVDITDLQNYINNIYNSLLVPLLNNNLEKYDYDNYLKLTNPELFIKGIINIHYDFKYINHLMNINNILFKDNNVYNNLIYIKQSIRILDNFCRTIDDYNKLKIFLYENPIYIHQDFNTNELLINTNQFIKININEICKDENERYRDNLIKYYAIKYYEKYINDNDKELIWIISNLQLLLTKKVGYSEILKNNIIYNIFVDNYSNYSLEEFTLIIQNMYINKTKKEFYDSLIQSKTKLNNNILNLIKKHINKDILDYDEVNRKFIIGEYEYKQYIIPSSTKNLLSYYFDIIPGTIFLIKIDRFYDDDNIINDTNRDIYIINDKICIQLFCKIITQTSLNNFNFYIESIIINNERVIKYTELTFIYPWIYVIPTNCFHLIYLKNNMFHIVYFINNKHVIYNKENLIGNISLSDNIYTITINKDNMMYPNLNETQFTDLCYNYGINKFNIIYINNINTEKKTGFYFNKKCYNNLKFKKQDFLLKKLNDTNYESLKLLNETPNSIIKFTKMYEPYLEEKNKEDKFIKSIEKISFKISQCTYKYNDTQNLYANNKFNKLIDYIFNKMIILKNECETKILSFTIYIKDKYINDLFENYHELYNYLLLIKKLNLCNTILEIVKLGKLENICSQIKIYNDMFDVKKNKFLYLFEPLFELITGNEIYDEQMKRYINIISKYNTFNSSPQYLTVRKKITQSENILDYTQSGGNSFPLHHFMMAKGKSSIITPLLSLYFKLIYNKKIFIIVPEHLVPSTNDIITGYINIFNINKYTMELKTNKETNKKISIDEYIIIFKSHDLFIFSDSKIKELFLLDLFNNTIFNQNVIMLIDEFDYILDPIKSNFNMTTIKNIPTINEFNLLNPNKSIEENIISIKNGNINEDIEYNSSIKELIKKDIQNIIIQLNEGSLKENIKWGIHPTKCIAIPYRCKDVPLLESNFSSIILTIYLTLYYYIVIKNYEVTNILVNYIKEHNLYEKFFLSKMDELLSVEMLNDLLKNPIKKIEFYNFIFTNIFLDYKIASHQLNTSFVDIINIDNIFKIGYSGTVNINLPPLKTKYKFDKITPDYDEEINVEYAILKSKIISYLDYDTEIYFFRTIDILKYDAIIDITGLFKNEKNETVVMELSKYFKINSKSRDIIYTAEDDNKYVMSPNLNITSYNKFNYYEEPFIYYSNAHIVGVDIKQDLYPHMKGLCIIDKLTEYSQIAQGMFRLRKINMGHEIHFIYLNRLITCSDLLIQLQKNDKISKENKYSYLIYQTIKSEIRKKTHNYLEPIKYYHIDYKEDVLEILQGIISEKNIIENKLECEYDDINKLDIIKKLVYNIDSMSLSSSVSTDEEQSISQAKSKDIIKLQNIKNIIPRNIYYDYIKYDFNILDVSLDEFINNTIKLDELIYFLPNILTQSNTYNYSLNLSGNLFVYFDIYEKILIIPGYLIIYFNKKYPILDYSLSLINIDLFDRYNQAIKNKFIKTDLFKLLNYDIHNFKTYAGYICFLIIYNNNNISIYQREIINFFNNFLKNSIIYVKIIERRLLSINFVRNKINFINKENFEVIQLITKYINDLETYNLQIENDDDDDIVINYINNNKNSINIIDYS